MAYTLPITCGMTPKRYLQQLDQSISNRLQIREIQHIFPILASILGAGQQRVDRRRGQLERQGLGGQR